MTTMSHRTDNGTYVAAIEYHDGDEDMHGVVLNTNATLHFAGGSIKELRTAFADTIAEYEAWCAERGKKAEKPYSGHLAARLGPERHARLALAAARHGKSINAFLVDAVDHALEGELV